MTPQQEDQPSLSSLVTRVIFQNVTVLRYYPFQGRRQRGDQWCQAPPFEIGAPLFHVWPPPLLHASNTLC